MASLGRRAVARGTLAVPGDKSISHRALILAALGTGESSIHGVLDSADTWATREVLAALGRPVPSLGPVMRVAGHGLRPRHVPEEAAAPCANSGTTARLLAGVAAAQPTTTLFDGDLSLRARPMQRIAAPLAQMGAGIHWRGAAPGLLPMEVRGGALQSIRYTLDVASAQVKSGILLAGLVGHVPVSVREDAPTRDHTERLLRTLGVDLPLRDGWLELQPPLALPAAEYLVPGDPSAAAFFVAFALAASRGSLTLQRVLLNPRRVGFLRVVERMGGVFDVHNEATVGGEVVGDLVVHASPLRGIDVSPAEVPDLIDELPVLAILAALADGETRVRGAGELRHKESDRLRSVVRNLRAVGVAAEEEGDGFVIPGGSQVGAATITTHGDHRIAMAFGVLSRVTGVPLPIDDPSCVAVSYPTFWSDLANVDGSG